MSVYANLLGTWTKLTDGYCVNGSPAIEQNILDIYIYSQDNQHTNFIEILTPDYQKHFIHVSQIQVLKD